jgi:hypothetical protein
VRYNKLFSLICKAKCSIRLIGGITVEGEAPLRHVGRRYGLFSRSTATTRNSGSGRAFGDGQVSLLAGL